MQAAPVLAGRPGPELQLMLACPAANRPTRSISAAATTIPMTQPRTLRNLVHSARTRGQRRSRPAGPLARCGVIVGAVMA